MRITVFADHDLKHSLAGGANVNLEENLRRLSSKFKIRLLSTWEQGLPQKETVQGVEILRFKGNMAALRWSIPRFYKENLESETDLVWDEVDFSVPWLTPLFTKKPILMHCLHFQKSNFFYELPKWKAALAYAVEPLLYKLYRKHAALAISQSTKDSLLEIGFNESRVRIVSPGLSSNVFQPEAELKRKKSQTPLIACLSRLRAWKGVHFSIQAMKAVTAQIPDAKLVIIGAGPYEPELLRLTEKLGLNEQVQFLGRLSEEEKLEWLRKSWALLKTSNREGWGIDVLEANACGTPAVGWKVPGTQDSVQDQETGFLVPQGDLARLTQKICVLLTDGTLREKMSSAAQDFSRRFTWDESAKQIESLVKEMVHEKK